MREIVAVLVNVRSVHNVGSIFRTSDAAGIKKIYLCGITPSPLDRLGKLREDFSKVALGAERSVAWEKVVSTPMLLKKLRREGYEILAVEQARRSIPYHKANIGKMEKIALVLGNEVGGLTPSVLKLADKVLEIPMHGKKESLNVSVAFGIVAYRLRHR